MDWSKHAKYESGQTMALPQVPVYALQNDIRNCSPNDWDTILNISELELYLKQREIERMCI